MGATAQFALVLTRYMHEYKLKFEQLGKIAVSNRYHASLIPERSTARHSRSTST